MYRIGELIEHDGKLAQYRGSRGPHETPQRIDRVAVSQVIAAEMPGMIGQVPSSPFGNEWSGTVRTPFGGEGLAITDDWKAIEVTVPIPKPRNGRRYTWLWSPVLRRWQRDYYDYCSDCGQQHNPAHTWDDDAGKCAAA